MVVASRSSGDAVDGTSQNFYSQLLGIFTGGRAGATKLAMNEKSSLVRRATPTLLP
jgi:hypothetical protein